jgi:hypothetical protein
MYRFLFKKIPAKLIKIVFLFFAIVFVANKQSIAQATDWHGKWNVDSISVAKKTDNNVTHFTITTDKKFETFAAQPLSFTFDTPFVVIEYRKDRSQRGNYRTDNNRLVIELAEAPLIYNFEKSANQLALKQTVEYIKDGIYVITEEYNIYLHAE